jgi:hypothetical protein
MFIQNDHVIQQVSSAVANESFSDTVLPRTAEADSLWHNPETLYCLQYIVSKVRGAGLAKELFAAPTDNGLV